MALTLNEKIFEKHRSKINSLVGGTVGYFLIHPFTMVVQNLNHRLMSDMTNMDNNLAIVDSITHAFSFSMNPMSIIYTIFWGGLGYAHSKYILSKEKVEESNKKREQANAIILGLVELAGLKHDETSEHLLRTRDYAKETAQYLGYNEEYVRDIYNASPLHDIGKMGISDYILKKNGPLTYEEMEEMKNHTVLGGQKLESLLKHFEYPDSSLIIGKDIAYFHHENWDGTGYPYGLSGENIPLHARIFKLADVYDALTSDRCYRKAFTHEKAVDIILEQTNHFDPEILSAFEEKLESKFLELFNKFSFNTF